MWKGAWGIRPLGNGIPSRPAMPVVMPRRKISQWKPAGLRSGNSVPWAMSEDTISCQQHFPTGQEKDIYRYDRSKTR